MKFIIGSLNTKMIQSYEDRINDIIKLINENNIDIMCFQEMTRKGIKVISDKTNMKYIYSFGNAILTKLPIIEHKFIGLNNYRGAILAKIICNKKEVNILATHLDHLKEDIRMKQITKLYPYFKDTDFLIGDLNSLNIKDYSKNRYNCINKLRIKIGLEAFKHEVIDFILSNEFKINNYISMTCPHETRVDYIFYKNKKLTDLKLNHYQHSVIDTINNNISDHNMLIMEMSYKKTP
jgi:endonuclease/exonuclease/phosphatase family metal-dependent hydrolase